MVSHHGSHVSGDWGGWSAMRRWSPQSRQWPDSGRPTTCPTRPARALLTLREQVIAPILASVCSPRLGRKPATWTRIDRDYETLRNNMQTLFHDLGITTTRAASA